MIKKFFLLGCYMKIELCRLCGCETKEFERCNKCRLIVSTICNCCANILSIQVHRHQN